MLSQTPVLPVLLKIATAAEYIWMDQTASAPPERKFPQEMRKLAYKVCLRLFKHLCSI